jgi:signal transduction histidine kinase
MLEVGTLIVGASVTSLISLAVLAKNYKSSTNLLFVILSASLIGWSVTTYLSLHVVTDEQTLFWIRFIMFFVVLQLFSFLLLAVVFPSSSYKKLLRKRYIFILIFSIVTGTIALSPYLFPSFEKGGPLPGPGMIIFLPHALVYAITGLSILISRYKKATGAEKIQLQYFLAGTLSLFTLVPLGNFVIPVVFRVDQFVALSPLYAVIFSALIAYAILKKKLFDFKAAVARSVAYLLMIATVTGGYSLAALGLSRTVMSALDGTVYEQFVYLALAVFLALTFQPLKKFFDHVTNRLFFRDAYDTDVALAGLGKILAEQTDLEVIVHAVNMQIVDVMKIQNMNLVVIDEEGEIYKQDSFGTRQDIDITKRELDYFRSDQLTIAGQTESDSRDQIMNRHGVDIIARLRTVDGVVGYMLVGPKQSGSMFRSQDISFIEIAAKQLAIAVQNARYFSQISEFNATLQDKVDKATAKLEKTNEKLKELDSAKDEFISMASHQLRTPLTTVKGYLSMLLDEDAGKLSAQQKEFIEQAFGSSQRMVYLIADLLNVSRLSTGKFVIESKNSDLSEIVEQEVEQLQRSAKVKSIKLSYKKPKDFPRVNIDETKIRQVIMNFTDNALYYTPSKGRVEVSLEESGRSIEFKVKDNGIGVPQALQHKLFTKFYRAENAQAVRPDGTGLGLFMAKKVILAQGGSIIFNSKEDKGSTFGFTFPKQKILANEKNKSNITKKSISILTPSLIEEPKSSNAKKIQVTTK